MSANSIYREVEQEILKSLNINNFNKFKNKQELINALKEKNFYVLAVSLLKEEGDYLFFYLKRKR